MYNIIYSIYIYIIYLYIHNIIYIYIYTIYIYIYIYINMIYANILYIEILNVAYNPHHGDEFHRNFLGGGSIFGFQAWFINHP